MLILHGPNDDGLDLFAGKLRGYLDAHPNARAELYRDQEYAAVRIQITDPRFRSMSKVERHDDVWPYLHGIDEKVFSSLYSLVLVSPADVGKTGSSLKFQDLMPVPEPRPAPAAARTKKRVR